MRKARRLARRFALQALYQWQLNPQPLSEIETQFQTDEERNLDRCEVSYFQELLHNVVLRVEEIDARLAGVVARPLDGLDPVERAVLRIGAYELVQRPEVPFRVVIDEAVELAKRFGATASHRFVNSVLDRLAAEVRSAEVRRLGGVTVSPVPLIERRPPDKGRPAREG